MTIHERPPRVTRVAIRLPVGMSFREALAAKIEALINKLDSLEPDPDLEPSLGSHGRYAIDAEGDDSDREDSLGSPMGGVGNQEYWSQGESNVTELEEQCEDEGVGDFADREPDEDGEPSLGSLDAVDDQRGWNGGFDDDRELDDADAEEGGDLEPSWGWSNPLGAKVDGFGRLIEERVPDRQVRQ